MELKHFEKLIEMQKKRVAAMKEQGDFLNFDQLDKIIIGVCGGDGIGPTITDQAHRILKTMLAEEVDAGKIEFKKIENLTIEYRAQKMKAIPDDVLAELKECHVILKGPTTTPRKGDEWPNIESANVAMRKELDLFANVRPVSLPEQNIQWRFFRENTEGAYAAGSLGMKIDEDIAVDFTFTTEQGTDRIIRLAFEHAKKTGQPRVTAVTKANIIKTTDGMFLDNFYRIAKDYPEIEADDWYIDIMTAKLVDEKRRHTFKVMVLPNLYGDILTDEAAEFQGGVGTAGSANIGKRYAMFEAIHGSAPRMVTEGRAQYADPSSMFRASVMLLEHIGQLEKARVLETALNACAAEQSYRMTGRDTGSTSEQYADYVMEKVQFLRAHPSGGAHAE